MALARFTQHGGNEYNNIHIEGGRTVLGNVYGESSDERTLKAILDSLSYTGMTDRRDTLREAQEGTLDWTFSKGKTKFLKQPDFGYEMLSDYYEDVEMNFKTWLEADYESLFCVMGKPGSGKSTFMYVGKDAIHISITIADWALGKPSRLTQTLITFSKRGRKTTGSFALTTTSGFWAGICKSPLKTYSEHFYILYCSECHDLVIPRLSRRSSIYAALDGNQLA